MPESSTHRFSGLFPGLAKYVVRCALHSNSDPGRVTPVHLFIISNILSAHRSPVPRLVFLRSRP